MIILILGLPYGQMQVGDVQDAPPPSCDMHSHTYAPPKKFHIDSFQTGKDKRGRRRSVALPPSELSWEDVGNMWQNMARCGNMRQHMTKCGNMCALRTMYDKCKEFVALL